MFSFENQETRKMKRSSGNPILQKLGSGTKRGDGYGGNEEIPKVNALPTRYSRVPIRIRGYA
jgi:hypothetical protein